MEDEVMIVVAAVEGQTVDPVELFECLRPRMAHFMLPRYIRMIDELSKTPTCSLEAFGDCSTYCTCAPMQQCA